MVEVHLDDLGYTCCTCLEAAAAPLDFEHIVPFASRRKPHSVLAPGQLVVAGAAYSLLLHAVVLGLQEPGIYSSLT